MLAISSSFAGRVMRDTTWRTDTVNSDSRRCSGVARWRRRARAIGCGVRDMLIERLCPPPAIVSATALRALQIAPSCGRSNCKSSPMRPSLRSPCAAFPGHLEVEADRAPPVLVHHHEMARQVAYLPGDDHQVDRRDQDRQRARGVRATRRRQLSRQDQGQRRQLKAVNLHGDQFHPEWNYTIKPKT